MNKKAFSEIADSIPKLPGIYKYFDEAGTLIYVGKAKHLRKRISSYFHVHHDSQKTVELVKNIHRIEYTIVDNEADAFFLENSLIKEYLPHYNINLKDDKSYPYVVIRNESYPRVYFSRKHKKEARHEHYGPYTSVANVKEMLEFIKQQFPLRTCTLNLNEKNIQRKKFKVCLEYHLGNCKGPCEGLQTAAEYEEGIQRLRDLLKGNTKPLMQYLKSMVSDHATKLEFERAAIFQQKIESLRAYKAKSTVVNTKTGTIDVFSILEDGKLAYVNYLAVNEGSIFRTQTITLEKNLEETAADVLSFAINNLRSSHQSEANEIIVPFDISYPDNNIKVTVPKMGDKKKLLELSKKNVNYFQQELQRKKMLHLEEKTADETQQILLQMQKDLHLSSLPDHIECFDNSNLHGTNAVAAMVCFRNGIPSKKDYRHFNIKTVEGINDFASMKEVVYRRYSKLLLEGEKLPSLIIIDGGKGQLSSALESIRELGIYGQTTLVGLAKNQEEIFFPEDSLSLRLPWDSESLKLIRRIRDAVHRFGITHHRNKRSNAALDNELEKIDGIGKATMEKLLNHFKSVTKIRQSMPDEIERVVGKAKAKIIIEALTGK
jgi:excinuclease ABC subunit C